MSRKDCIKVCTRIYSPNHSRNDTIIKECDATRFRIDNIQHTFDYVANNVSQQEIFNHCGKPLINKCLAGFNATLFAYGQTGSGKTYTIQGQLDNILNNSQAIGILPRMVRYLFNDIQSKTTPNTKYLVTARFYQIYNDVINDCIEPNNKNLKISHTK
eukprot:308814_1